MPSRATLRNRARLVAGFAHKARRSKVADRRRDGDAEISRQNNSRYEWNSDTKLVATSRIGGNSESQMPLEISPTKTAGAQM